MCCVKWGTKYGPRYVNILRAMVARHLAAPHRFVCLTEDPSGLEHQVRALQLRPGRQGWWNKVELFRPGLFGGRVLYLDLDVVVVGPLDGLVAHKGIIHLDDWRGPRGGYGSAVMVWDAGEHVEAWTKFSGEVSTRHLGDQDWLSELGGWARLPFPWCVSYRFHCANGPPAGAKVVCFHGHPKPHEARDVDWVRRAWRENGVIAPDGRNA